MKAIAPSMSLRTKARRVLESHEIQVKTKAVEEALIPFIEQVAPTIASCTSICALGRTVYVMFLATMQVCSLRGWHPDAAKKKGSSRNVQMLISLVHKATNDFLTVGRKIANENTSIRVS